MKTILVATDFSKTAHNAVNYAADMALSINANLLLLTVADLPLSYTEVPIVLGLEDIMRNTENDIKKLSEEVKLRMKGKINITTEVGMGFFNNELKQVCERVKPYAVVLGSQGKSETEHILFGSHATRAVSELDWPVITVPPNAVFSSIKKIGLASDLTKVVETTPMDEIKMLVSDFNAELHILNTGQKEVFSDDIVFESGLMQEMAMTLKPKFHFIANDNTEEGIINFVDKNNIDLLIVLPKRHSFLKKLVHKSHSKQLVLHSHAPVMAIH